MLINLLRMETKIQHEGFSHMVYAYSNNSIHGVMIYLPKKENVSKHNILISIFKCCVSKTTFIVLLPNLKRTYDQIYQIIK